MRGAGWPPFSYTGSALRRDTVVAIIDRLSPQSWSESRAAIMEVNATALDDVVDLFDVDYQSFAQQAKAQLLTTVAAERARETDRDRMRDERFEW